MIRKTVLSLLLILTAAASYAETQRYMVVTRGDAMPASLRVVSNSDYAIERHVRPLSHVPAFGIDLTAEEAEELRRSGEVLSVEQVVPRYLQATKSPLTPHIGYARRQSTPYGITLINAEKVWPASTGQNVNVAVADTGLVLDHPDLVHAYAGGANIIDPTKPPIDDHGHGTHVSGTIAAANNGIGVVGVAPGVKLWAVKILNKDGFGTDEQVAAGIDWVIAKKKEIGGSWVVNLSVGSNQRTVAEETATARALDAGIILVAAAGNSGFPMLVFPARYPGMISVGAIDAERKWADFASHGLGLTVVAPGVDVPSTYLRGKVRAADVEAPSGVFSANGLTGSPIDSVRARIIDCGYGRPEDFPPATAGRIAVVQRGPHAARIPFQTKALNAKAAGAVGVIIYNDDDAFPDWSEWSLLADDLPHDYPVTVGMSHANGVKLLQQNSNDFVRITVEMEDYDILSGTSMSTPHVTGTVALLLSLVPGLNNAEIQRALETTAVDVGPEGWDLETSWGLVDAFEAAKLVAPTAFGLQPNGPKQSPRRRSVRP